MVKQQGNRKGETGITYTKEWAKQYIEEEISKAPIIKQNGNDQSAIYYITLGLTKNRLEEILGVKIIY